MRRLFLTATAFIGLCYVAEAQTALEACPPSEDATARRECLFKLWWEQVGKDAAGQASPSAPANGGGWVVSETTSPVDYSQQVSASVLSRATAEDAPLSLTIRCRARRIDLSVNTIGAWKAPGNNQFRVAYQIEQRPVVEERWTASAGGKTASFNGNTLAFLQALPTSGQILIRVFDSQNVPHEAIFRLDGLAATRQKVVDACKDQLGPDRSFARQPR
jgi:hypothetical protein